MALSQAFPFLLEQTVFVRAHAASQLHGAYLKMVNQKLGHLRQVGHELCVSQPTSSVHRDCFHRSVRIQIGLSEIIIERVLRKESFRDGRLSKGQKRIDQNTKTRSETPTQTFIVPSACSQHQLTACWSTSRSSLRRAASAALSAGIASTVDGWLTSIT